VEKKKKSTPWNIVSLEKVIITHYCVHKGESPDPVLSQKNPVHTLTIYFFKIHLRIILPCIPRSTKWSFHFSISFKTLYAFPNEKIM